MEIRLPRIADGPAAVVALKGRDGFSGLAHDESTGTRPVERRPHPDVGKIRYIGAGMAVFNIDA